MLQLVKSRLKFNFRGIISSCFEAHLAVYVELEEKTLMEHLEKLVQEETWETEEGSQTNILWSSMQVFLIIRRSLKRCSALTKNQTLFSLFEVFKRILKAYASKFYFRLPKGGTGIVAAATGSDGQIKTSDKDERMICYIVNTSEYCHQTSGELAENVSKIIDSIYADKDEFSAVITKALLTLVHGLETKFDAEMIAMTRLPWATLESVGDQSEFQCLEPYFLRPISSFSLTRSQHLLVLGFTVIFTSVNIYQKLVLNSLADAIGHSSS